MSTHDAVDGTWFDAHGRGRAERHVGRERDDRESGFTLIEIMVSLAIMAIIAVTAAATLLSVFKSTSDNRARVAAANLALREIEVVRSAFTSSALGPDSVPLGQVVNYAPLPGGTLGNPLVVDGRSYTVTRVTQWQSQGANTSVCDGGSSDQLAFLRVSVTVTWPGMGKTTPVTSSTLLTPTLGTYDAGTGHIKSKITDGSASNLPVAGTTVTLKNSSGGVLASQVTSSDGCAFFAFLDPGSYTITASQTGYVDQTWASVPSQAVTVVANVAAQADFTYAPAATTTFTFDTSRPTYAPATSTALTVYNPLITSTLHTTSFSGAVPAKTLTTFPYSDGLVAWAGDCTDADPGVSGTSRPNPVTTAAGQTGAATVLGAAVAVTVKKSGTTAVAGATVEAVHATTGCPSSVKDPYNGTTTVGEVLTFPLTTDSTGTSRILLPYGTWTIKVIGKTATTSFPSITLLSSGTYPQNVAVSTR